ncbi:MAG: tryptophan synthase subunit alpha [Gammaproteobacteria bacterium]|nr:tryptophan synthase subunit alpha [Gammaproteobacteria bacterium]MBU1980209.1 tryptophan synthase subunit alpha [Gammaproteobacteria bacterium]
MSRIAATFSTLKTQGKKALIPFITAGDPQPDKTVPLMHRLVEAGANILELGVPFSDPMADGPTIQRASERALKHGVSLRDVLGMVVEFRKKDTLTPVVLMGYANPIEAMGYEQFAAAAATAGVDGVLTVDYPPEESAAFVEHLARHYIDPIYLLSPTTPEARMAQVGKLARGFIYYVSLKGVTGSATLDIAEVARKIPQIRAAVSLPVGIGFGIRDGQTAKTMSQIADAVVIGSRIVEEIENSTAASLLDNVYNLVKSFRDAMDGNK